MYSLKHVLFYAAVLFVVGSGPIAAKAFASDDVSAKSETSLIADKGHHNHHHHGHYHHNDWYNQGGYYNSYPYYYNGYYPNYYNSDPYYNGYYNGYDSYYYGSPGVSLQFGF